MLLPPSFVDIAHRQSDHKPLATTRDKQKLIINILHQVLRSFWVSKCSRYHKVFSTHQLSTRASIPLRILQPWVLLTELRSAFQCSFIQMQSNQTTPVSYYGRSDLHLLAGSSPLLCPINNNSTYPPRKYITSLSYDDCALLKTLYEGPTGLHHAIEQVLQAHMLLGQSRQGGSDSIAKSVGLYRMGFTHLPSSQSGIVLLLILNLVDGEYLAQGPAKKLLQDLDNFKEKLGGAWSSVSIDICSPSKEHADFQSLENLPGFDQQWHHPTVYHEPFPVLGSSLGQSSGTATGTLSCYLTRKGHEGIYALTNCHVLFGQESSPTYRYQDGDLKQRAESPSRMDITASIQRHDLKGISTNSIKEYKPELGWIFASSGLGKRDPPTINTQIIAGPTQEAIPDKSDVQSHNNMSNVAPGVNTSYERENTSVGLSNPDKLPFCRLDWALIKVSREKNDEIKNTHRVVERNSRDFFVSIPDRERNRNIFDDEWYTKTIQYFTSDTPPMLTGVSNTEFEEESIYTKIPGARIGYRLATYTGIKATHWDGPFGRTREHTFCAIRSVYETERVLTQAGDSGSCILDKEHRLAGVVWGGDALGFRDATFVTPIGKIFRDIESTLGWEAGSVGLLGAE